MNKAQYNVSSLLNTQMKTQVKNVLKDVEGVKKVNVNITNSSIEVDYNDSANVNEIKEGIEKVGCRIE